MRRILEFIAHASQSRTTALLVILVIGAAIPLTVLVAQKQQEVRQQASYCEGVTSQTYCTSAAGCKWTPFKIDDPAYAGPLGTCSKDSSIFCNCDTTSQTCILDGPGGTPRCFPKGKGALGSYCGTPSKTDNNLFPNLPNKDACESGYCDFSLRCTNLPSTGGTGGTAPGGTSTGGTCAWGPWTDTFCGNGGIGIQCTATQMYQTRYGTGNCNYVGVGDQGGQRCLDNHSTCISGGGTCTDADYGPWNDAGCGNGGVFKDCNVNEMYQTRSIASGKGCNLNTRDMERCVPNSTCGGATPQCNVSTDNLRCSGSQVQQCQDDGIWKTVSDCASFGQVCKAITGTVAACSSATPPTPACDTGIECTGACTAPANTCGAANGTESGCQFTKLAGGGTCNNAPAPPRACAIDKCVSPKTCSSGDCIDTTVPPPVGGQTLSLSVGLSGVGNTGDRKNPNASSLSNKSPVKNKIAAIVTLFRGDTQFKSPINAELIYTPSSGKYEGEVGLGTARDGDVTLQVVTTVKVSTPGHLRKGVDVTIAAGKTPVSVNLFAGDLNADGELSIVDYGIFISCSIFGKDNKQACGGKELDADFNMDGNVDQADYNLFLREYGATGE